MDEELIKTLYFPPYHPKTVRLEEHDHETPFWDAALIPYNHRDHVFLSKEDVFHIRYMV